MTLFQQFTTGSGCLRSNQNDCVIDDYVEPTVIWQTHTAPMDKYHLHYKLASYCMLTVTRSVCCVSLFLKYIFHLLRFFFPPTKSEGYSFRVVRASVRPFRPSVRTFCLSGTISQYLLVRFNSFLVQMISNMYSWYPLSLVKIDPLTLELLPLFKYRQL